MKIAVSDDVDYDDAAAAVVQMMTLKMAKAVMKQTLSLPFSVECYCTLNLNMRSYFYECAVAVVVPAAVGVLNVDILVSFLLPLLQFPVCSLQSDVKTLEFVVVLMMMPLLLLPLRPQLMHAEILLIYYDGASTLLLLIYLIPVYAQSGSSSVEHHIPLEGHANTIHPVWFLSFVQWHCNSYHLSVNY